MTLLDGLHPITHGLTAETLIALFAQDSPRADLDPGLTDFLRQVARDCGPEELADLKPKDIHRVLADFWTFAERRDQVGLRLRPAMSAAGQRLGFDLLEIVQRDRPFLVDSVMGEIAEAGLIVRAMFHPVVDIVRDQDGRRSLTGEALRESLIQVHLDPVGEDRADGLLARIAETLGDVAMAVDDFSHLQALMYQAIADLAAAPPSTRPEERAEHLTFLQWLAQEHFVFLGARIYEYPRTDDGGYAAEEPLYEPGDSLGVLRDASRSVLRRSNEPAVLSAQLLRQMDQSAAVVVAKSNLRSRVHRRGYMDYIGIKRFGADGRPSGEVRFVGLFTSEAYDIPAREVPLIRMKVRHALARAGEGPSQHNEKRLRHILEEWPRDELFQIGEDDLLAMALGVMHLHDRPRVRIFARRDPFDRFVSVLLFVPKDRYDSALRIWAGERLAEAYHGRVSAYYPSFSDAPLARVHFIIGIDPAIQLFPDLSRLEAQIAEAAKTWEDRFEALVRESGREHAEVARLLTGYAGAFSTGYRAFYPPSEALADIAVIERLTENQHFQVRAFRQPTDSARQFHFKLYRRGPDPVPLADVLPSLDDMGLKALIEDAFEISPLGPASGKVWVHEFLLDDVRGEHLVFADVKAPFEAAFAAIWRGDTESDRFNRLVLELGISWRDAAVVRALARFRRQSGLDPSASVQERSLCDHPELARLILDMFRIRFDPAIAADVRSRGEQAEAVMAAIVEGLQEVGGLDADRVIRRMALLVQAITRTNFYQQDRDGSPRPYISFKVDSRALADLPAPKPFREIFVWAPDVEGVHLRFGPVARGGLRWSDRRDDFRTEVLGLVKAQQVKNAVIVPVGSKGGFFPKRLPRGGTAEAIRDAAIKAYRTFLCGLLDLTDNIDPAGRVVHPDGVVVHDADDPYLVVAADKGTATFSDIANEIAQSYGFWLGDAFASGGSVGYDHKVMGITARGAWEAVKRHFREAGKDIQAKPFTVVGVGDMSGDVFGNGMLLSKVTRLIAAFDHRHIFVDPNPDCAQSWAERARMFALPRSSWDDYDRARISEGGGVFARNLKSIAISPQIQTALGIKADALSPNDLITAILKCPAELLYLGGIGTYVKAKSESHADAGDKSNDAIRVNAVDLRCQIIGEGANLGLTQAGRIEFALRGGRINTDAIDNSAGVNSSDHEVNIKILTALMERSGKVDRPARNALLASMTSEVAAHVLVHNYDQTLALSLIQVDSLYDLEANGRLMQALEAAGQLDRRLEGLPDATGLTERRQSGQTLTRPELAVLLAYAKLDLFDQLIESHAPDDGAFLDTLIGYFPSALGQFSHEIERHRLRREIIATVLTNDLVNMCGPTFPLRLRAAAGCDTTALVVGFAAARRILDFDPIWQAVAALDGAISATGQIALFRALANALRAQTYWLARRITRDASPVRRLIDDYQRPFAQLKQLGPSILSPVEQQTLHRRIESFVEDGADLALAERIAALQPLTTAAEFVDLARSQAGRSTNSPRSMPSWGPASSWIGYGRRLAVCVQAIPMSVLLSDG